MRKRAARGAACFAGCRTSFGRLAAFQPARASFLAGSTVGGVVAVQSGGVSRRYADFTVTRLPSRSGPGGAPIDPLGRARRPRKKARAAADGRPGARSPTDPLRVLRSSRGCPVELGLDQTATRPCRQARESRAGLARLRARGACSSKAARNNSRATRRVRGAWKLLGTSSARRGGPSSLPEPEALRGVESRTATTTADCTTTTHRGGSLLRRPRTRLPAAGARVRANRRCSSWALGRERGGRSAAMGPGAPPTV